MKIQNSAWENYYESVIGKSHIKIEMPNQDAIISKSITDDILISAVADGHGSKKCIRSDVGAKFAVNSSIEVLEKIKDKLLLEENKLNTKAIGKYYTKQVISLWKEKVNEHLLENPINYDALTSLSSTEIKSIKKNKLMPYGSTLLIIVLIHDFIVCYQLGDGDILFVSKNKKVSKPIKRDDRHIGNDTLSLCIHKPEKEFKIRVFRDLNHFLEMIILSTDGYSNSFSTEKGFLKVGTDLAEMVSSDGFEVIEENLKDWIEDTSNNGSGDDTSVSVITRIRHEEEVI